MRRLFKVASFAAISAGTALAQPVIATADSKYFQTPSGNITCVLDAQLVECDISDYTFTPLPPPECAKHIKWGNRFTLAPGRAGAVECHGDTTQLAGEPTLNYGQTITAGTLSCISEQSGVKCSDSGSKHFFRVSRDSFDLG